MENYNFNFVTAAELVAKHPDLAGELKELQAKANAPECECSNCPMPVWKYAGLGLCFGCVTGETDASDDYELVAG